MAWGLMLTPAFVVFLLVSLFGTFFVFMSGGLLGMWISLELALFGFLPILNGKTVGENECASKYFVVQGVGSGLILLGLILIGGYSSVLGFDASVSLSDMVVLLGFMMKLGVFPMHFWFPSVMGGSSWFGCFWLSVVQKVGPFWGISGLGLNDGLMNIFVFMLTITSMIGGLGGLAQVQFRPLLAYSSLGQTGWMGLIVLLQVNFFIVYILVYSILLSGLLLSLHVLNAYKIVDVPGTISSGSLMIWVVMGSFFISLSGMPPLAGCALKLMGIMVISASHSAMLGVLILSSMISLYYYLSVFINSVVCLGSVSHSVYSDLSNSGVMVAILTLVVVFNWLGGLPLFVLCGGLLL